MDAMPTKKPPPRGAASRREATDRLVAADSRLARELSLRVVDLIAKDAEDAIAIIEAKSPRRSAVTGDPLPAPAELTAIRKKNLFRAFEERRELLADALTVADVAKLLSVGRQTPHDRAKAGTLLAVRENSRLLFPAWQFDPDGPDGVLAGLPEVLRARRGPLSPLGEIRWFLAPKSLMGGLSPLDALREGDIAGAVAEARAVGAS
jgi:hypothetical protein